MRDEYEKQINLALDSIINNNGNNLNDELSFSDNEAKSSLNQSIKAKIINNVKLEVTRKILTDGLDKTIMYLNIYTRALRSHIDNHIDPLDFANKAKYECQLNAYIDELDFLKQKVKNEKETKLK